MAPDVIWDKMLRPFWTLQQELSGDGWPHTDIVHAFQKKPQAIKRGMVYQNQRPLKSGEFFDWKNESDTHVLSLRWRPVLIIKS